MTLKDESITLDGYQLTVRQLSEIARTPSTKLNVGVGVIDKVQASRKVLENFVADGRIIYGVNTSMGGFVNWLIPIDHAQSLQENLISAVATNVGAYLPDEVVRAAMAARINSLARGFSAISEENFLKLVTVFNAGIIPCIPEKGSLGASGDLGPLACIALVCVGKWKAKYHNEVLPGDIALKTCHIDPMKLSFKEGLALINGTSTMTGVGALVAHDAENLIRTYDLVSSLSFEALNANKKPFDPIVHKQKPHRGQLVSAQNIFRILTDSKMIANEHAIEKHLSEHMGNEPKAMDLQIEDAYSIRCTPQIMGPIRDSIRTVKQTVEDELNSSNDNPLILAEENEAFHNGHFHGQYISMAMDHVSISMTTLSNLSERRIDRFMDKNHSNHLPAFLCKENPGLRLGLMGGQFMSTSVTAENRSLCQPVSIQTLPSTGDFQDIVSMGLIAARRARTIIENTRYVVAFELICACQAADIRGAEKLSVATHRLYEITRKITPYLSKDMPLTDHIEAVANLLQSGRILSEVEALCGALPL